MSLASGALSAVEPKLPVIGQVGVIPVQWEGQDSGLADARASITETFPRAVRAARRFRVLSDDLVDSLWKDADGREELRVEFELHSFVSLTVEPRGDTVSLTARLLDAYLKTQLAESETIPRSQAATATGEALEKRLEELVFRLFNRIPVDVSVTSVQGPYVTLSGGAEQGIQPGDKVELVRTTIKSLHPANGTWLDFSRQPLGQATVVEAKNHASVAKLTGLVKENAVEVGDGAKIPAIAGRARFQRLSKSESFKDGGAPDTIVVPPLYTDGSTPQKPKAPAPPKPSTGPFADKVEDKPVEEKPSEEPPKDSTQTASPEQPPKEGEAPPPDSNDPSVWDTVTDEVTGKKAIDDVHAYVGPYWWKVKSKAFSQSGKFPIWLLNSLGAGITRTLLFKIKTGFGGGLLFGKTSDGSYLGYDSYARMYWEDALLLGDGFLKWWKAGGHASFSGMNVPKGKYGGGDWIRGGVFGGLGGSITPGEGGDRYDWFGEFSIMPLNIGRLGYDNGRKVVESSFGQRITLGAFRHEPARIIQWGGALEMTSETQTLKNGQRPQFTETSLKAMAKYVF